MQHDENFKPLIGLGTSSPYPNEHFFIRKFNKNTSLTGKHLRLEEEDIFSHRLSHGDLNNDIQQHIRDYHKLCSRDHTLVSLKNKKNSDLMSIFTEIQPSNNISRKL